MMKIDNDGVVESIVCNDCGREYKKGEYNNVQMDNDIEFHAIDIEGGYHSRIGDGDRLAFHLCDICMINLIASFRVAPDHDNPHCYSYEPDERTQEEINNEYHDRLRQMSRFTKQRETA